MDLTRDWRLHLREALETHLQRGYPVTGFTITGQGSACPNAEGDSPSQEGTT
jgi:predicted GNAT superfamily acetyltransferase